MKRKEMVDKIYKLLSKEDYIGTGYYEMADMILKEIEKAGMSPPRSEKQGYEAAEENPTGTKTYYRKKLRLWDND